MQRARRLGVALAVVGTLLVVAWWLAGDRGSPGGAVPEPIARGSTRVAPEAPVGGLPSSPERGAPASATASEASRLDPPDGSVVVSCRVRFQGTDRGPKQFQFRFAAEEQTEGSIGFIKGADGVAEARFPGPGRYKLFDLRTDGVEQRDIEPIVDVTQGGELALDVAEPKSLVLVVRAAETLSPLREAQAWVLSETESRDYLSRNAIGRVSSPAAGPFNADIDGCILLPPSLGTHVNVAVRSPGTACERTARTMSSARSRDPTAQVVGVGMPACWRQKLVIDLSTQRSMERASL